MDDEHYDGTKLLSLTDVNGNKPEIYLCTANRTGGKTTFFNRMLVNCFLKKSEKFMLLYRYGYELEGVADTFFKDIGGLFFSKYTMKAVKQGRGVYYDLYLCDKTIADDAGKHCGYACAINSADAVKKKSHFFSDVSTILFDEFQSETNNYCPDEVRKFISIFVSVARGKGQMHRYVRVIMVSNPVSLINPYYTKLGISYRLNNNTKFLRGDGWVLEQGFVNSASEAMKNSGFIRAFSDDKYVAYASENVYLNDNMSFIETPTGRSKYICTIKYKENDYAIRTYPDSNIVYCDNTADLTYPYKISVTTEDHNINYVMLTNNDVFISGLRKYFERGCFRFKNLEAKEAVMCMISHRTY